MVDFPPDHGPMNTIIGFENISGSVERDNWLSNGMPIYLVMSRNLRKWRKATSEMSITQIPILVQSLQWFDGVLVSTLELLESLLCDLVEEAVLVPLVVVGVES